jgi:hypothetical protein
MVAPPNEYLVPISSLPRKEKTSRGKMTRGAGMVKIGLADSDGWTCTMEEKVKINCPYQKKQIYGKRNIMRYICTFKAKNRRELLYCTIEKNREEINNY